MPRPARGLVAPARVLVPAEWRAVAGLALGSSRVVRPRAIRSRAVRRGQVGQAVLLFAVALASLVTLVAVVVNLGAIATVRTELHHAAGQAAAAAATRFDECPKETSSVAADARARAVEVAQQNRVAGRPVTLDPALDVQFGFWNPITREYEAMEDAQAFKANTVEVTSRRTADAPDGPVDLVMSGLLGVTQTDKRSRAFGIPGGAGFLDTTLAVGLNECAVREAIQSTSGTDPVPFPLTLSYLAPSFDRGALAARPADPEARDLAICPPPVTPTFPQTISDPLLSADPECSRQLEAATYAIRFNLLCATLPAPPGICDSPLGDLLGDPTMRVLQDLLLFSAFFHPDFVYQESGGDLSGLVGSHVVPVYSSEEIETFEDFDSTAILFGQIETEVGPVPVAPFASFTFVLRSVFEWPSLPTSVRYAPVVGFARYDVSSVTPIFHVLTFGLRVEVASCTNNGLCTIPDCCQYADDPFPLELEVEQERVAGFSLEGQLVRDALVFPRRAGGLDLGISATFGSGPRLVQPTNL